MSGFGFVGRPAEEDVDGLSVGRFFCTDPTKEGPFTTTRVAPAKILVMAIPSRSRSAELSALVKAHKFEISEPRRR